MGRCPVSRPPGQSGKGGGGGGGAGVNSMRCSTVPANPNRSRLSWTPYEGDVLRRERGGDRAQQLVSVDEGELSVSWLSATVAVRARQCGDIVADDRVSAVARPH